MLHVTYEAAEDIQPGRLAEVLEGRGRIHIRLDTNEPLDDVIRHLNLEMDKLLSRSDWFQLWKDEIVSRHTPGRPLRVRYLLKENAPVGIGIGEVKGLVRVHINAGLTTAQFAAAMNPVTRLILARGHWFQQYAGEIIDMSPDPMARV